ncbi:MAG TPA: hypothetical protein VEZ26_10920, partial [Sphingomonadaceae bacterium]|nr:hypothetical protein [Sphingomonadaceae bacterium]
MGAAMGQAIEKFMSDGKGCLMRYLLLIAVVTLAGCQTTAASRTDPGAAMAKLPSTCPMRVTFPDAVSVTEDNALQSLPPGSRHIVLSSVVMGA